MTSAPLNRRDFPLRLAAFFAAIGAVRAAFGHSAIALADPFAQSDEISHAAESIHQEITFKASRSRVYAALTEAGQFNKVVQLSAAGMSLGNAPTEISREAGGVFSLFGGHILGRHIELVPNERIVQAWRVVTWNPGVYSIAKFELTGQDSSRLTLDHTGFPHGQAQHLADGWKANYWEPLQKYLAPG
jgi:activator of HSP90 ATPase